MTTTPNYGFKIAEGTDTVNLLTQSYPNFTDLDTILKSIELTGITSAVATKVGTVFNIVRTNTALNVLKFVATANYASGDTFTVDGVSVTATAVDGTALPAGAFVINQTVMALLNGTVLTVLVGSGASTIDAEDVNYDNSGSGLAATDVQAAIDEVVGDIPTGFAATAITYDNTGSGLVATDVQAAIDELANNAPAGWTLIGEATGTTPIPFVKADYTEVLFCFYLTNSNESASSYTLCSELGTLHRATGGYSGSTIGSAFSVTIAATTVTLGAATVNGSDYKASCRLRVYAK